MVPKILNQVLKGKAHPPVLLGHRDHQPQVALYQLFAGSLVSGASVP
jgi:hypothetical protein